MTDTPWVQARAIAAACGRPLPAELVPIAGAVERVLAEPVQALTDLPGFDTSSMDGWAVSGQGPWDVIGTVLAGATPAAEPLRPGQAMVIATGAAVPPGADAVVRREDGIVTGDVLTAETPEPGTDIRPKGEECRLGETLTDSGRLVTPAIAGMVAAAGVDRVSVVAVPRVALLLLGDELLDAGVPGIGQVRDSLGPQLPGWVARMGGRVVYCARVADTVEALEAALRSVPDVDVILTTGGTAAGPVDCLHTALRRVGATLAVDSVAVRPGHPMLLADCSGVPLIGLPGNPQSAVVALVSLGAPLLRGLLGQSEPTLADVTLDSALGAPANENRLVLGTVTGGRFTASSHLGSAMLRGLATADGFAVLPPGGAASGDTVPWLPLP